jgi:hypoxanthine phosphoribosyltransferase
MTSLAEIERVSQDAECLYTEAEVEVAIARLGEVLTARYRDSNPLVLAVVNGGIIFCGKLLTHLAFPLELEAIHASRYRGKTRGSLLEWRLLPTLPLQDRAVLVVDDVLDEGFTLAEIIAYCRKEGAASVETAVLVDKLLDRAKPCRADYVGLTAPDRYLFGYGMDYKNYLRNAAGIYACKDL